MLQWDKSEYESKYCTYFQCFVQTKSDIVNMWNFVRDLNAPHHCIDTETNGLNVGKGGSTAFLITYTVFHKANGRLVGYTFAMLANKLTALATKKMMQKAKYVWAYNAPFDLNILLNTFGEEFYQDYDFENWYDVMSLWRLTHNVDEPTDNLQLKNVALRELNLGAKAMQDKVKAILKNQEAIWNKTFLAYAKEQGLKIKADDLNKLKKGDIFSLPSHVQFFADYERDHPLPNYYTVFKENPDTMVNYACWDPQMNADLVIKMWPELIARGQKQIILEEGKVVRAIAWQQRNGITLDIDYLEQSKTRVLEYYQYIEHRLQEIVQKSWDIHLIDPTAQEFYFEGIRLFAKKTRSVGGIKRSLDEKLKKSKVDNFLNWWIKDPLQLNINSSEQIMLFMYYAYYLVSPTGSWDKVQMDEKEMFLKTELENTTLNARTREVYTLALEFLQFLKLYRRISKWANTYIGRFIHEYYYIGTGKIHPSFNGNKTVTGRFSSPFQQQPKDSLYDVRLGEDSEPIFSPRRMVKCSPDAAGVIVLDLSQIEIRVNDHYTHLIGCPDKVLDNVLFHGGDMHAIAAASAFHNAEYEKDPEYALTLVDKHERSAAKNLNFAMQYGGGLNAIATHPILGKLDKNVQVKLYEAFRSTRAGTVAYQEWAMTWMRTNATTVRGHTLHYVENMYGRRYFASPIWVEKNSFKAINYLIQGTCADTLKSALIRLYAYFKENHLKSRLIVNIHDEVQIEICHNEWFIVPEAKKIMETVDYQTDIPIVCDIEMYTDKWDNKKEYVWKDGHLELMEGA